jgi:hypothetical protein
MSEMPVDAITIAKLCQGVSVERAASLIDQYAKTYASCAVVTATAAAYDKVLATLGGPDVGIHDRN